MGNLYEFTFYLKPENNDLSLYEYKIDPPFIKCYAVELEWWKYDQIISSCFSKIENTLNWTIDKTKKSRLLLENGIKKIETSENEVITEDFLKRLDDTEAEIIVRYYEYKTSLSEDEIIKLQNELSNYNDQSKIIELKPPYDRMIIELDIARRLGGYTRQDILSFSKKDIDKLYILVRSGLSIPLNYSLENKLITNKEDSSDVNEILRIMEHRKKDLQVKGIIKK